MGLVAAGRGPAAVAAAPATNLEVVLPAAGHWDLGAEWADWDRYPSGWILCHRRGFGGLTASLPLMTSPTAEVLPNGVTLVNAPSSSRNIGVMLIVRAGSRDETSNTAGLAHFLEHTFFK